MVPAHDPQADYCHPRCEAFHKDAKVCNYGIDMLKGCPSIELGSNDCDPYICRLMQRYDAEIATIEWDDGVSQLYFFDKFCVFLVCLQLYQVCAFVYHGGLCTPRLVKCLYASCYLVLHIRVWHTQFILQSMGMAALSNGLYTWCFIVICIILYVSMHCLLFCHILFQPYWSNNF